MPEFDIDILKRNVRALMDKHGTKQEDLASFLDMSQPNVSKALSLKDKKCFTLEQACRISDYFNVSVDFLVGKRTAYSAATNREIAEMLVSLIESGTVSFSDISMTEHVYSPETPYEGSSERDVEVNYPALFFRNYWTPDGEDVDGSQFFEIQAAGNATNNDAINEFLRRFIQIYTLHKKGDLYDDTYKSIVQDYLSRFE